MKSRGFTLVEVMVALVIIAIGLLALLGATSHYTRQAHDLRERTLAQSVALDVLAGYQLDRRFPDTGMTRGEVVQAEIRWQWLLVVSEAPGEPDLRRLDIRVTNASRPDVGVTTLTGFIGRD